MIYNSRADANNSENKQQLLATISQPAICTPHNGIYYWSDRIPGQLKTRRQLLLDYKQPQRQAKVQGLKRTILDYKWRLGGSTDVVSTDLIDHYQQEARQHTL